MEIKMWNNEVRAYWKWDRMLRNLYFEDLSMEEEQKWKWYKELFAVIDNHRKIREMRANDFDQQNKKKRKRNGTIAMSLCFIRLIRKVGGIRFVRWLIKRNVRMWYGTHVWLALCCAFCCKNSMFYQIWKWCYAHHDDCMYSFSFIQAHSVLFDEVKR